MSARLTKADILLRMGQFMDSIKESDKILEETPHNVSALVNKGLAQHCLGDFEGALLCNEKAINISKHVPELWNNYGLSLAAVNRREEAYLAYQRALSINPDYDNVINNIGILLIEDGRHNDAINLFRNSIERGVVNKAIYFNMGNALASMRRDEEAIDFFDQAIYMDEDYVDALLNKAFALLRRCSYKDGWAFYEARLRKYDRKLITSSNMPIWDGSRILGNRLLIYAEQGFGDTIQFSRLLPGLVERGYDVYFEVQPQLVGILKTLDPRITLVERGKPLPTHDYCCPLLSLCRILMVDLRSYDGESSYLRVDRLKLSNPADRLKDVNRTKIGVVWKGSPTHSNDKNRSMQLTSLLKMFTYDFEWVSLQRDPTNEEIEILKEYRVSDFSHDLADFTDTALVIENLDLVISVDTSVAHLAGALGKRVLLIVAFIADFRWAPELASSPWYPSFEIFRQSRTGSWEEPLNEIILGLEKYSLDEGMSRSLMAFKPPR
jgi:tetratricopeptide (TPR) repeat protein